MTMRIAVVVIVAVLAAGLQAQQKPELVRLFVGKYFAILRG